jgi:hypothetical protein
MSEEEWPSEDPTEIEDVLPPSEEPSPAPPSSPVADGLRVSFNVLRRLPNVDLRGKWVDGERPVTPLPVETVSLPEGEWQLELVSVVPDTASDQDRLFVSLVEEYGVWVIGQGDMKYGGSDDLIPALHGWNLSPDVHRVVHWKVRPDPRNAGSSTSTSPR